MLRSSWQLGCTGSFRSVNQQFLSRRCAQKGIVSSRSGWSTYSFLSEPPRQPLLNRASPLWQRARTAAFTFTSNQINVLSIMGVSPPGHLGIYNNYFLWCPRASYVFSVFACVGVHVGTEIKRAPGPLGAFHLLSYVI